MAAEQGDVEAQYNLAVVLAKGEGVEQDYEAAAYWFAQAAEQGDESAAELLKSLKEFLQKSNDDE